MGNNYRKLEIIKLNNLTINLNNLQKNKLIIFQKLSIYILNNMINLILFNFNRFLISNTRSRYIIYMIVLNYIGKAIKLIFLMIILGINIMK